jgi:uncharacterized phiE125 gp8 family phage protein
MGLSLVTPAVVEPISVVEAKAHLRITDSYSDTEIYKHIKTARQHIENVTRRRLVQQTWDYTLAEFPIGDILLPIQPVSSVTSVSYVDGTGATATFTTGASPDVVKYDVITDGPRTRIFPKYNVSWPTTRVHGNAVTVRFVCGYEPTTASPPDYTANIPPDLIACLKLIIGDLYENREKSTPLRIEQLPGTLTMMSPYIMRSF